MLKAKSLRAKILLSLVPIVAACLVTAFYIYSSGHRENPELGRALQIARVVVKQELEMVKMSDHLKTYLLNPQNKAAFGDKKAADKAYSDYSAELQELVSDAPEILALNAEMAKFDETTLDERENKVGDMIAAGDTQVLTYFEKEYLPARQQQNANFMKLKDMVQKYSENLVAKVAEDTARGSTINTIIILCSLLFGIFFIVMTVNKSTRAMESSMGELSGVKAEMTTSIDNLNEQGDGLSRNSSNVAASLEETVASLEEMSSMIKNTASNSQAAFELSTQAFTIAESGNREVIALMNSMTELSSSSKKIEEIITVIDDIAFQTNLLALNAAVEAARAGEQGKGFAVVADAVRVLAAKSAQAAKDISGLIRDSVERINHGTQVANGSSNVLKKIVETSKKVSDLNSEVAKSTQEQSEGVTQISRAMNSIDQAVQSNANAVQQISSIAEQISTKNQNLELITTSISKLI